MMAEKNYKLIKLYNKDKNKNIIVTPTGMINSKPVLHKIAQNHIFDPYGDDNKPQPEIKPKPITELKDEKKPETKTTTKKAEKTDESKLVKKSVTEKSDVTDDTKPEAKSVTKKNDTTDESKVV